MSREAYEALHQVCIVWSPLLTLLGAAVVLSSIQWRRRA